MIGSDGKAVVKPINLYFLAYYDTSERDCYTVKPSIVDFLKAIKAENDIDPEVWADLCRGKIKDENGRRFLNIN